MKSELIGIKVSKTQKQKLIQIAENKDITISQLIRQIIKNYTDIV